MSNVAIDAVISGTPVFVKEIGNCCWKLKTQEIETPTMGNDKDG